MIERFLGACYYEKSDLTKLIAIGAVVTAAAATTAIVISKHKKHKTMLAEHTKTLTKKSRHISQAEDFPHLRQHFILCVTAVSLRRIFIYLQTVLATAATTKQALSAVAEKL